MIAKRHLPNTYCLFFPFFSYLFLFWEVSLFPSSSILVPFIPVSSLYGEYYVVRFSLPDGVFLYLVTTGWISCISLIFFFFSLISLIIIADGPHHYYYPACGHKGSSHLSPVHALQFLSRCKLSTLLTTRQPMVEFYVLTFPRFPLRKKEHNKSYFGKNRTNDFRLVGEKPDKELPGIVGVRGDTV